MYDYYEHGRLPRIRIIVNLDKEGFIDTRHVQHIKLNTFLYLS